MARHEHSAGVILYRGDPPEYLLLNYPSGHWDFAKGHIEEGESAAQAARREVEEETGLDEVEIHPGFEHRFEYFYNRGRTKVHKSVVYFAGRVPRREVRISHEHRGFVWLPYTEAHARVTYANAKETLERANAFVVALSRPE